MGGTGARPASGIVAAARPKKQDDYATLSRFAGKPFEGLLLNASAKAPSDMKLSLVNQSNTPICVKKWEGAAGYNVQVRGPDGKPASMTEKGKSLFDGGSAIETRDLKPKETIEKLIPLAELFDMKTPGEYAVLASLPVVGDVDAVLTAAPLKIRIDRKPTAQGR